MGQYPQPHNDKYSLALKVATQQAAFDTCRNMSGGNAAVTNDAVNLEAVCPVACVGKCHDVRALNTEESRIGKNVVDAKLCWVE